MRARRLVALVALAGCGCAIAQTPAPSEAAAQETPAPTIATTPAPTESGGVEYIDSYTGPLCGSRGIPCYAVGCGPKGMDPCIRLLPNCDFTLDGYADGTSVGLGVSRVYTNMVTGGELPVVQLPRANATEALNMTALPIVMSATGDPVDSCKVRTVTYQNCKRDSSMRDSAVECTWETWYVNLRREHTLRGLNKSEPEFYKIDEQFTIVDDLLVAANPILPQLAVSLYSIISGAAIKLGLTCEVPDVGTVKSCVMFDTVPEPYSPNLVTEQNLKKPEYRFKKPPVPAFPLPPNYHAAYTLNVDNPITLLDGRDPLGDCLGDETYYQGEDGQWYNWYFGSDGEIHELYEAFYTSGKDVIMPAMQDYMVPALNDTLWGRNIRMLISCGDKTEWEGWLFFGMGVADGILYPEYDCRKAKNRAIFCTLSERDKLRLEADDISAASTAAMAAWGVVAAVLAIAGLLS